MKTNLKKNLDNNNKSRPKTVTFFLFETTWTYLTQDSSLFIYSFPLEAALWEKNKRSQIINKISHVCIKEHFSDKK